MATQAQQRELKKFTSYTRETGEKTAESRPSKKKKKEKKLVEAYIGHIIRRYKNQEIKASTMRTAISSFLGGLAMHKTTLYKKLKQQHIKKIQRFAKQQLGKQALNKAPATTWKELKNMTKSKEWSQKEKTLLRVCWLTCQRLGNMEHFQPGRVVQGKWEFALKHHKTSEKIGSLTSQIAIANIPKALWKKIAPSCSHPTYLTFDKHTVASVKQKMRAKQWRWHSLRRGGLKHHYTQGMSMEELRRMSGHTSEAALLNYLK